MTTKQQQIQQIKQELDKNIIGADNAKEYMIKAFLTNQHILLESTPGLGKTELCKAFSSALGKKFNRIQGMPDIMPQDIIGYTTVDGKVIEGPIQTEILLVDEINRMNSRTQSALLSAMSERKIIHPDGRVEDLPDDFMVIATENPLNDFGTYPLPNASKDRFGVKVFIDSEIGTLKDIYQKNIDLGKMNTIEEVDVSENIFDLIQDIFDKLNPLNPDAFEESKYFLKGPSNRSGIQFIEFAKANALLNGKSIVSKEYVINEIVPVFGDKIYLNEDAEIEGISVDFLLKKIIDKI